MTSTTQSRKRQAQVEAGAYDGRYKTRVVQDKKKKAAKNKCRRSKNLISDESDSASS